MSVVVTVALVALGVWWLVGLGAAELGPSASGAYIPIRVYNSERACRNLRTMECSLRLARNPHIRYATPGNAAGRVWHGDPLAARCVIVDGILMQDEEGVTSARWYLVRTAEGVEGWLPGVRTRNTRDVRECTDGDSDSGTGM
ncbi:hypothetical protein [Streptomyces sp. MST-110588]|uniref:hypothetical protein n=1 Tax=Streptomyces sp. MST-110588 TaxID=2833628 RepID=UPI001F5D0F47|nr:hypothetical protein [Streptomyces sp. MST-110588]